MKYLTTIKASIVVLGSTCLLGGCLFKPFKFPIQQGNLLVHQDVVQVREGMTTDQVQFLLGTPMLQDLFHPNTWHYVYYEKQAYKAPLERKLIIYFENQRVTRIERDNLPSATL